MINATVIIVGGGPAGSTCAWALKARDVDVLILDKREFPRQKLCAGWITPKVLRCLKVDPPDYPHSLTSFKSLHFYIRGRHIAIPTRQYAIRRIEFDHWLLQRSAAPVFQHDVRTIRRDGDRFIIDDTFRCRYLVGAGGTGCPVYRNYFRENNPRNHASQITTLEYEFPYDFHDPRCHLWFFDYGLPGYSWYVPKKGGYVNVGIGGKVETLRSRRETIQQHWDLFAEKLTKRGLLQNVRLEPKGYTYYLRHPVHPLQKENVYLIGDSAGLATVDMGEGIGPAVESGLRAAQSILTGKAYSFRCLSRYSIFDIIFA
jgi:flavin-dependent dehydrogenase